MNWNLNAIYSQFDDHYKADFKQINVLIQDLIQLAQERFKENHHLTRDAVELYVSKWLLLDSLSHKCMAYVRLRLSTNTEDLEALAEYDALEKALAELAIPSALFEKKMGTIDNLSEFMGDSSLLNAHHYVLSEIVSNSQYVLSDAEEHVIAQMAMTGSSAWALLWEKLTSALKVSCPIEGEVKELTLSEVRNLAYTASAEVRSAAYAAELAAYPQIEVGAAACLNGIKGEVLTINTLRGYHGPLEQTLKHSRLTKASLDAMIEAMTTYLPHFRRYFKAKAKYLGKETLAFHDLFAPVGEAKHYTYDEAKAFIIKHFSTFSDSMGQFAQTAFEKEWVDVLPHPGKVGGAFCYPIHAIAESRILMNFSGDLGAVTTLAHELGHGYHNTRLFLTDILNTDVPMVLAETASTFCETLVADAVISTGGDDAFVMLETSLQGASQVIVDILSRYYFESQVFEQRKTHTLSVEELKQAMLDAQERTYGEALDPHSRHPYMWVCKPHYYDAAESFYNFPYAFGLLFAKGLYSQYLQEGQSFIPKYDRMLEYSGQNSVKEVCATMAIEIETQDFWIQSLERFKLEIDLFEKMVDERCAK